MSAFYYWSTWFLQRIPGRSDHSPIVTRFGHTALSIAFKEELRTPVRFDFVLFPYACHLPQVHVGIKISSDACVGPVKFIWDTIVSAFLYEDSGMENCLLTLGKIRSEKKLGKLLKKQEIGIPVFANAELLKADKKFGNPTMVVRLRSLVCLRSMWLRRNVECRWQFTCNNYLTNSLILRSNRTLLHRATTLGECWHRAVSGILDMNPNE